MKFIETAKKMLAGCAIALVIAVAAKLLEQLEESAGLLHTPDALRGVIHAPSSFPEKVLTL